MLRLFSAASPGLGGHCPNQSRCTDCPFGLSTSCQTLLEQVPLIQSLGGLRSGSVSPKCPGEGTKTLQITPVNGSVFAPEAGLGC